MKPTSRQLKAIQKVFDQKSEALGLHRVPAPPDEEIVTLNGEQAMEMLAAGGAAVLGTSALELKKDFLDRGSSLGCKRHILRISDSRPLPMPSWCAWLTRYLALSLMPVRVSEENPNSLVMEGQIRANNRQYRIHFESSVYEPALELYLALFPACVSPTWRGPIYIRAAAKDGEVRVSSPSRGRHQQTQTDLWGQISTLHVDEPSPDPEEADAERHSRLERLLEAFFPRSPEILVHDHAVGSGLGRFWPRGWPRWVEVSFRPHGSSEPAATALYDLAVLAKLREQERSQPERSQTDLSASGPEDGHRRGLTIDFGTTTTCLVETVVKRPDLGASVARSFDLGRYGSADQPSGWLCLATDNRERAGFYGCGERLRLQAGMLPSAVRFSSAEKLEEALTQLRAPSFASPDSWLPQKYAPRPDDEPTASVRRFKAPDLLEVPDELEDKASSHQTQWASTAFQLYAAWIGLTVASGHSERGSSPSHPRLDRLDLRLTRSRSASQLQQDERLMENIACRTKEALNLGWPKVSEPDLVDELDAVRWSPHAKFNGTKSAPWTSDFSPPSNPEAQAVIVVDFGGSTLDVVVEVRPPRRHRMSPYCTANSYRLGGELFIDATALANTPNEAKWVRSFRSNKRDLRFRIDADGTWPGETAQALREAILHRVLALVDRQVQGTLKIADPAGRYLGSRLHFLLLGGGWLLTLMDVNGPARKADLPGILSSRLSQQLGNDRFEIELFDKRQLCKGANHFREYSKEAVSDSPRALLGVDVSNARWFGEASTENPWKSLIVTTDGWWRDFVEDRRSYNLEGCYLHRKDWTHQDENPVVVGRLNAGSTKYAENESPLVEWVKHSGGSRVALDIYDRLTSKPPSGALG